MLPLVKEFGSLEETLNLPVREAFAYRDANSARAEFEEYYYWLSDKKREAEKKDDERYRKFGENVKRSKFDAIHNPERVMKCLPPEKDKKKVDNAMQSANNFFAFARTRGFR